jgi:hypothetical protein
VSFWCLLIAQKTNEIFSRISALASKKEVKSKKLGHFILLIGGFMMTLLHYFLKARARTSIAGILEKLYCFFGRYEDTKRTF